MALLAKKQPVNVTLPSGAECVLVGSPSISRLLASGKIPNVVLDAVTKAENATDQTFTVEEIADVHKFQAIVVANTVAEPTVSVEDDPNVLSYFDLSEEDVNFIMQYAMTGEVPDDATFRNANSDSAGTGSKSGSTRQRVRKAAD